MTVEDAIPIDGRVPDDRGERNGRADPRRYSRASLIAVIAATEAWADAGLSLNEPGAGVLVGSGARGIDVLLLAAGRFAAGCWNQEPRTENREPRTENLKPKT